MRLGGEHQPEIDALLRRFFSNTEPNGNGRHKPDVVHLSTDEEVVEACRRAKNAAKFASLFDEGDTSGYGSPSEADLALICMLAFYTQNPDQLDRLYRRSALHRGKWERHDYRKRTIKKALENLSETYAPKRDRVANEVSSLHSPIYVSSDDETSEVVFFAELKPPKEREFLIEDIAPKAYATVMFGAGGVAKSLAALLAGIGIAGGAQDWFGLKIKEHGPVLYLDFELDVEEQHRRVRDLCAGLGQVVPGQLAYLSGAGMTTDEAFSRAYTFCKDFDAKAVIVDSMGLALGGDMEKADVVLAFHKKHIDPLRLLGVTPIIVDHQGKLQAGERYQSKSPFGSAFKQWAVRSVLQFEAVERNRKHSTLDVRVRHTKTNFGTLVEPFGVRFVFGSHKIGAEVIELSEAEMSEESTAPAKERIKGLLQAVGPLTASEIATRTELAVGTVHNKLSELMPEKVNVVGNQGRAKVYDLVSSLHQPIYGDGDDEAKDRANLCPHGVQGGCVYCQERELA